MMVRVPMATPMESSHDARLDLTVVMGGTQLKVDSQDFKGGEITAVMGGVEVDFSNASVDGKAVLQVFVAMGGVDIEVRTDWSVIVNGIPLLAGVKDKSVPPAAPAKRLTITGYVIMGGVEIETDATGRISVRPVLSICRSLTWYFLGVSAA